MDWKDVLILCKHFGLKWWPFPREISHVIDFLYRLYEDHPLGLPDGMTPEKINAVEECHNLEARVKGYFPLLDYAQAIALNDEFWSGFPAAVEVENKRKLWGDLLRDSTTVADATTCTMYEGEKAKERIREILGDPDSLPDTIPMSVATVRKQLQEYLEGCRLTLPALQSHARYAYKEDASPDNEGLPLEVREILATLPAK